MEFLPSFGVLIASILGLIKSADYFIKGSSSLSLKLGISPFVIGLTVVAIGTSAPELFINILASFHNETELSIGNILGSNIVIILLGFGMATLFTPLSIKSRTIWKEVPFSLLGALLIFLLGSDKLLEGKGENALGMIDGIIFLLFFIIFIVYSFGLNSVECKTSKPEKIEEYALASSIFFVIGGIIGLIFSGEFLVHSTVFIADFLGMSHNLIGLTVIAVGTSLPELATSIIAAHKNHTDMLIGGVIGTVVFNIFFTLGVTATITDLPFSNDNLFDAFFLIFISVLFFIFMFIGKKHTLTRNQGIIFIILYLGYIGYAIIRG